MAKIVISVEGGLVNSVHSDDPKVDVEVVDWDNLKETLEDSELTQAELDFDEQIKEMNEIY